MWQGENKWRRPKNQLLSLVQTRPATGSRPVEQAPSVDPTIQELADKKGRIVAIKGLD